ncbi:hypothetical protein CLV97_11869 [Planifilum fimeticola]|uniref:Uncharacterized protein n=1 Tax=Planifilum fimeticola TaxID=201975 RepID=A0A2T0LD83_9BACL|nr:hypothetical protein [Planifilum fimeticola]PRX39992.1 hypothetical protein CLV97_11869 [Planifilum fimeticola]
MSRRLFLCGPLLTWFLAGIALYRLPGQTPGSSLWRYFSVDFLVFLVLWAFCFHILFRSVARGIAGLMELPLPFTHRNRLRWAIPVASGLLLLLFLFFQAPAFTALGAGFFGGREMRSWLRKRRARFPG